MRPQLYDLRPSPLIHVDSEGIFFFFFQAEDGIRDHCVTGVQTCALPISDQKAKQGEYEVADSGLRLTVKKADKVLADLYVGKSQGGGTMVRPVGKDEVWLMSGAARFAFDKTTSDWRDKSLTTFDGAAAETLEIKSKAGGSIKLKAAPKKDGGAGGGAE